MKTILFCGGGSAGHVIPNIAIIEELKPQFNCVYIGTRGIEKDICGQNSVEFFECDTPKLIRGKIFANLTLPFKLVKAVKQAGVILDKTNPCLIFSKGGYACVPAVLAAKKRGIPVITHESDIEPGLATKFIAKRCKKVLTSFPQTARKFKNGIYCGPPIRGSAPHRSCTRRRKRFQNYKRKSEANRSKALQGLQRTAPVRQKQCRKHKYLRLQTN